MVDEQTFYSYVAKMFNADAAVLSRETRIHEDLGATSQSLFGVSALLEKMSGKKVSFADVNNCATLGDALALAEQA